MRFRGRCHCPFGCVSGRVLVMLADLAAKKSPTAPAITTALPATLSSGREGENDGYVSLCQVGVADGKGGFTTSCCFTSWILTN
jgi:hypothetical protein